MNVAAIARIYALERPKATKYAMILSTAFPKSSEGIEIQYQKLVVLRFQSGLSGSDCCSCYEKVGECNQFRILSEKNVEFYIFLE